MSGAAALTFEAVWFRQAGLAFGNSVWASALVLSGFMGGLALGNVLGARYGDRVTKPLRTYALAEAAIALTGVALAYVLPHLGAALAPWLRRWLELPWILNPFRLLTAFVLLLIPSTAMGVTLPLLTRAGAGAGRHFGDVLGRLYGWNTLGAAIGVVLAETHLVGALGVRGTALAAGAMSVMAAAGALWLSGSLPAQRPVPSDGTRRIFPWAAVKRWLAAASVSGFCLLALEVVWFRFLLLFVRGDSVVFAVMLAIVLAGIALGGLAAATWIRFSPNAHRFSASVAFVAGFLCIASYATFPLVMGRVTASAYPISGAPDVVRVGLPLMFPVSFCSGMFFTFAGAALRNTLGSEAGTTGLLTLANTAGAALGSLTAGFLFLPVLGMEKSFLVVAMLYAAAGVALPLHGRRPRRIGYAGAVALLLSVVFFPFGLMETRFLRVPFERLLGSDDSTETVAVREGLTETAIYVRERLLGRPLSHRLLTNSFSMSGNAFGARRYMKLYVYWPTAVHPHMKRALLIAYGVGNTAKALTDSKAIETIDVVDISRDVLALSSVVYPKEADNPLRDPRVRVHVDDGRYFLQTTDRRFDLITGEPPPPGLAGVVNLYTREYFRLLYERLADGGMVTYWLPLADLTDVSAKAVLRAFCDVFEDCSLWNGEGTNLMVVGTRNARGGVSEEHFVRQWNDVVVAAEMRALGLERPEQLGALFIGDADYLNALTRDSPPLLDDRPKLLDAPGSPDARERLLRTFINVVAARERFRRSSFIGRLWPERLIAASLAWFEWQGLINAYFYDDMGWLPPVVADVRVIDQVHRLLTRSSLKTLVLWRLGSDADIQRVVGSLTPEEAADPAVGMQIGIGLIAERQYAAAAEPLGRAEELPQLRRDALLLRLYALCMSGQTEQAQRLAQERFAESPPASWVWMQKTFGLSTPDSQPPTSKELSVDRL